MSKEPGERRLRADHRKQRGRSDRFRYRLIAWDDENDFEFKLEFDPRYIPNDVVEKAVVELREKLIASTVGKEKEE